MGHTIVYCLPICGTKMASVVFCGVGEVARGHFSIRKVLLSCVMQVPISYVVLPQQSTEICNSKISGTDLIGGTKLVCRNWDKIQ